MSASRGHSLQRGAGTLAGGGAQSSAPDSPRHLPPLAGVTASLSSSFTPSGRSSHTHRARTAGEPGDDDALHWERSLHSEVVGSPRILLASPTSSSHRRSSDATAPLNPSFHTPLLLPQRSVGEYEAPLGSPRGSAHGVPPSSFAATATTTTVPSSATRVATSTYGATDMRTSPLLHGASRTSRPSTSSTPRGEAVEDDKADGDSITLSAQQRHQARHRQHMRKRLLNEDFFSSPMRKWRRDGRFPFKLLNNILIFLCLLIQLSFYQLPETVANEQQRQAIIHHFTGSDMYLSRAKGNLVSHPTLFLDEQVQVFQSIESFVDVYYNLTNTSVSELNYYYWQRNTTDRDKLLRAYHDLGVEAGQDWVNGEEVLQLLQEYQRRKRVKAYVRANQPPTSAVPPTAAAAAHLNMSIVQPVVMQVLAYPFSLRERWSPLQTAPKWFTFLLDASNPLGPFRHYNRSHTQHRQQQQQQPQQQRAPLSPTATSKGKEEGHKLFRMDPRAAWDTSMLSDANLSQRNSSARPTSGTTATGRLRRAPDAEFLQLVCHARLDVLTGRYYSPCRTPMDGAASPSLAFQGRKGSRALRQSAAAAQSVSSDLLFSFMDNVVAVRLFASVRHLSIPTWSSADILFHPLDDVAARADVLGAAPPLRLAARHRANRPAIPFNRSVYRWMMEKNLRVHRGGMVEAELVVRTSVVRLQPSYWHPAFLNALLLASLAALEIHLRRRALARIDRYRRRVVLEKRRLHRRAEQEAAARRVRQGMTPLTSAPPADLAASLSPSSSSSTSSSCGSEDAGSVARGDEGSRPRRTRRADLDLDLGDDDDDDASVRWTPWLRHVWTALRLAVYEELGFRAESDDEQAAATRAAERQPLLASEPARGSRQGRRRRLPSEASSHASSRQATPVSSTARAMVARRREEARQERLLARRYVSLQDSWRYQLQQSMGTGWHHLAMVSASLTLVYALLYLAQLVPLPTSFRADTLRSLALGLACLSSSVVFLSYARYFPRVYFPILITKVVIPRLLMFVLSIAPLFLGNALFFHIVFGAHSDGRFSTLGWSMMSLYFMTYGDSLLPAINTSERGASYVVAVLANVMTVLFVLLFMMTILNFALGITIHEWQRIRQRFGTVLNMSSILFSVRTREEVKAEALEKVRTSLELLLYMTYEDELAAADAAAYQAQASPAEAADGPSPRRPPSASLDSEGLTPLIGTGGGHQRATPTAAESLPTGGTEASRCVPLTFALPPPAAAAPDAVRAAAAVPRPSPPSLGVLSPAMSTDENESVQLSAATTIANMPGDEEGDGHDNSTTTREPEHREGPLSRSSFSDEL